MTDDDFASFSTIKRKKSPLEFLRNCETEKMPNQMSKQRCYASFISKEVSITNMFLQNRQTETNTWSVNHVLHHNSEFLKWTFLLNRWAQLRLMSLGNDNY